MLANVSTKAQCGSQAFANSAASAITTVVWDQPNKKCTQYTGSPTSVPAKGVTFARVSTCTQPSTAVWTDIIDNHTSANINSRTQVAYCELELGEYVAKGAIGKSGQACDAKCKKCENVDFQESDGAKHADTQICADWLVHYTTNQCGSEASCRALFTNPTTGKTNFDLVSQQLPNKFCQFPDESCKHKIMDKTQDEMEVVGTVGSVFLYFRGSVCCTERVSGYFERIGRRR